MRNIYLVLIMMVAGLLFGVEKVQAKYSVEVYWFYETTCPVCQNMSPWLDDLAKKYPEAQVRRLEISGSEINAELFSKTARAYGNFAGYVPATFINDKMFEGFDSDLATELEARVAFCIEKGGCISPSQKLAGQQDTGNKISFWTIGIGAIVVVGILVFIGRKY